MKLFQHSSGTMFSFGFDMWKRRPDQHRIFYSDFTGEIWRPGAKSGAADFLTFPFVVAPEFVVEGRDGIVLAYQPGLCLEIARDTARGWWRATTLRPEPVNTGAAVTAIGMYDFAEMPADERLDHLKQVGLA